jgi:cob(I)alamin adenosyltransferase
MTLEELADLIRANSANTNGRIDRIDARLGSMRDETNAALMNLQNDLTDIRGDIKEVRQSLDLASTVAAMRREIEALAAEVAELKRRAS